MKIRVRYDKEDWEKFQAFLVKDVRRTTKTWWDSAWFNFISWFVIAFLFLTVFQTMTEFSWPSAGITGLLFTYIYVQFVLNGIRYKRDYAPSEHGTFIGEHVFNFSDDTIQSSGKGYEASHSWDVVKRVERTSDAIYVFIDTAYAYIFPAAKLADPDNFYHYVSQKADGSGNSDGGIKNE